MKRFGKRIDHEADKAEQHRAMNFTGSQVSGKALQFRFPRQSAWSSESQRLRV
jgi:hypothetical protein